jgi:hypothetical protein
MGLKGYRLWVIGQLDSNLQSPTEHALAPGWLTQRVRASQPPLYPSAHSSTSAHDRPLPAYPAGHPAQVRPPAVLTHVESAKQPPLLPSSHSSTSLQPFLVVLSPA